MRRAFSLASFAIALSLSTLVAQERTGDDLFTWSGRLASGSTLGIKHYNGPIDVRQGTGDRVEFRAERRSRGRSELSLELENESGGVPMWCVWRRRSGWGWR